MHDVVEFPHRHPSVSDADARLGKVFAQERLDVGDVGDPGTDVETPAAPMALTHQRFAHDHRVERRDERPHREPVGRGRRHETQLANARQRQMQRPGDRRRGEREDVRHGAEVLEALLLRHAEMLFLVDDDEAEIAELDVLAEQGVRADHDVDVARLQPRLRLRRFPGSDHAGQASDLHRPGRETLAERRVVLTRQQGRRRDEGDLLARHDGNESGPERDLGLAEPDIAADQAIHGPAGGEIAQNVLDRLLLVLGLVIGKMGAEFLVHAFRRGKDLAFPQFARRGDLDQLVGDVPDPRLGARLPRLPAAAAEAVEPDFRILRSVSRDDVDVLDGDVELVVAIVEYQQAIVGRAGDVDRQQVRVSPDAVLDVDDDVSGRERRSLHDEVPGAARAPDRPGWTFAQDVPLGDDGEPVGLEAVLQTQHRETDRVRGRSSRLGPAFHVHAAPDAVIRQKTGQAVARARRIRRHDDGRSGAPQAVDVLPHDVEQGEILPGAFRREIPRPPPAEVVDLRRPGQTELGEHDARARRDARTPFLPRQMEFLRRQRAVDGRAVRPAAPFPRLPRLVVIGDGLESLIQGVVDGGVPRNHGSGQIIEQGLQLLVEQREPMLHPHVPPAGGDGLIERIGLPGHGAEATAVSAAEPRDRLLVQKGFADRPQLEGPDARHGALGKGIERANALQFVPEKVETEGMPGARREDVHDTAAHGELAGFPDGPRPLISVARQECDEAVEFQVLPDGGAVDGGAHDLPGRRPLNARVEGGDDDPRGRLGRGFRRGEPAQAVQARAGHLGVGGHPVIGQAVPRGNPDDFDVGCEERDRPRRHVHALRVERDMQGPRAVKTRDLGQGERIHPLGGARQRDGRFLSPFDIVQIQKVIHGL